MGDILCRVCGEPWDHYGARHGDDMTKGEYGRLVKGLGCPCCKGVGPHDGEKEKLYLNHLESLFNEAE